MANQNIRSIPDRNVRETGGTSGWHEAVQPNQSDMNRGREPGPSPRLPSEVSHNRMGTDVR
jgi:hypothetical protein